MDYGIKLPGSQDLVWHRAAPERKQQVRNVPGNV